MARASKSKEESKESDSKENEKGKNTFQEAWLNLDSKKYRPGLQNRLLTKIQTYMFDAHGATKK